MWVALDDRGGPIIVQADGYNPIRVSTFAIEQFMGTASSADIESSVAFTYRQDGHLFYVLSIPNLQTTWVYDVTTSDMLQVPTWHERAYTATDGSGLSRHRGVSNGYVAGKHTTIDYSTGALYFFDQDGYTDNGAVITRQRITPHISNNTKRLFYNWLAIDFKTGSGDFVTTEPQIMLEYSNDGGNTYPVMLTKSVGAIGSYNTRVIFNQLGTSRDRVFRLTLTDPIDWALSGAAIDIEPGAW
jgi:hypothetical protein